MSSRPDGFAHLIEGNGDITITHHGRKAATLRGAKAQKFLVELESADSQELMARLTGNYRRGNERTARNHPRNAGNRR